MSLPVACRLMARTAHSVLLQLLFLSGPSFGIKASTRVAWYGACRLYALRWSGCLVRPALFVRVACG